MQHFVQNNGFNTFRLPVGWQFLTDEESDEWTEFDQFRRIWCARPGLFHLTLHRLPQRAGPSARTSRIVRQLELYHWHIVMLGTMAWWGKRDESICERTFHLEDDPTSQIIGQGGPARGGLEKETLWPFYWAGKSISEGSEAVLG